MDYFKLMAYRFREFWQREKSRLMISLCAGILVTGILGIGTKGYSDTIQKGIADSVVRFHVLANSDSEEDQALKLLVRDTVLQTLDGRLKMSQSKEETEEMLSGALEEIRDTARRVVQEQGYGYDVQVVLSYDLFPYKEYGEAAFPAGMYDALRIEIGKAEGRNWWCVMFPPLCFVEEGYGDISDEGKEELKAVLSEEEYAVVVSSREAEGLTPKVKLKIVEWWQEKEAKGKHFVTKGEEKSR